MRRRCYSACVGLILLLCAVPALGEMIWPADPTPGQQLVMDYVTQVNESLLSIGTAPLNQVYECYKGFVTVGRSESDTPEDVQLILTMSDNGLGKLELWISDIDSFPAIAGACIHAAGKQTSLKDAEVASAVYADQVRKAPDNSFGDTVDELQGDQVRVYYSYMPDCYGDEVNWLVMTLIFARNGTEAGVCVTVTPAPDAVVTGDYEGWFPDDNYVHLDIYVSPTPDPNDAIIR